MLGFLLHNFMTLFKDHCSLHRNWLNAKVVNIYINLMLSLTMYCGPKYQTRTSVKSGMYLTDRQVCYSSLATHTKKDVRILVHRRTIYVYTKYG